MNARRLRVTAALAGCAAVCLTAAACGSHTDPQLTIPQKQAMHKQINIGIKTDEPGLGYREPDGTYTGLDVDVARYVAKGLGFPPQDINWVPLVSQDRETYLNDGKVDMVVASYSMVTYRTPSNGADIVFAGPYLTVHQDVLVRASDHRIKTERDLRSATVCSVIDSTSARRLTKRFGQDWAVRNLEQEPSYSDCVALLRQGKVEAVTTDNDILLGYAQGSEPPLRVLGFRFPAEQYGIGLSQANHAVCPRINRILAQMIRRGAWQKYVRVDFGSYAPEFDSRPPQVRTGCQ
jgi:glutamate transport system substrate-binding protein